jgi:uncharacterized GH25 family protein
LAGVIENGITGGATMIQGEVVDDWGRPVPDARVMVVSGPGPLADVALLTDGDGRFTFGLDRAGQYQLAVYADGHESASVVVHLSGDQADTVRVRLAPAPG